MAVPDRLGRYQLARMLGRGVSAAVFAGCDSRLDRPVAIKVFAQHIPIEEVEHEGSVLALHLIDGTGRALLADFGIASASNDRSERRYAGSLPYMAPERQIEEPPDPASDQFSFCVTLWEALHGVRPWDSNWPERVRERPPKRRSGRAPGGCP